MDLSSQNILFAFLLTLLAGLSTGIGSAVAFLTKRTSKKFLSLSLGFSGGVMVYVSFIELFPQAVLSLQTEYSSKMAQLLGCVAFFGGMGVIALIDKLIPEYENPHELKQVESIGQAETVRKELAAAGTQTIMTGTQAQDKRLLRMGVMSALAIFIHNFPEGLATFVSGLSAPDIAYPIAVAIALHNIPEGIAVAVPLYYATGNKRKSFIWSFLSGLSEPTGAIIGFALLWLFVGISPVVLGFLFAAVAGIMVFISLDELLPTAREYGAHHLSIYGMVVGMMVMAASLIML
ncbi:MAG: zinc transporter ZupT [Bacteroidales bacterium]|jgi:ZIP family zinc transporter|nr:zinc transporter ZupT [Bacteroidales bacterium]